VNLQGLKNATRHFAHDKAGIRDRASLKQSISTLHLNAIEGIEELTERKQGRSYLEEARNDDDICYIADLGKVRSYYPNLRITRRLDAVPEEMVASEQGCDVAVHGR
jgi:hypothetical protein